MIFSKRFLTLILCFIISSCQSQKDEFKCNDNFDIILEEYDYDNINKEWLEEDISFYKKLIRILQKCPQDIQKLIPVEHITVATMGNGYSVKSGSHGIGYININYDFIFMKDSLISYKLDLPLKDVLLLQKNKLKPKEVFIKTDGVFNNLNEYVYYYGFDNACNPHNSIKPKEDISDAMKFYMTPFSGIEYGCRGGYGDSVLPNRCAFIRLGYEQSLTYKDLIYIMNSINLASRLTAIEYYTKNINAFNNQQQNEIEELVAKIFLEFGRGKIKILLDDIGYYLTIEDAVNRQLENNCY